MVKRATVSCHATTPAQQNIGECIDLDVCRNIHVSRKVAPGSSGQPDSHIVADNEVALRILSARRADGGWVDPIIERTMYYN